MIIMQNDFQDSLKFKILKNACKCRRGYVIVRLKNKKASFFLQRPQFANVAKPKAKTSLEEKYIDDSDDFY